MLEPSRTAVVISTFSEVNALSLALHSFAINTPPEVKIVLADASNGVVTDRLPPEYRQRVASVVTTDRTPHPVTMHRGIERARELGAEVIVQSNDDIVVPPEWLRILFNEFESEEVKVGKVGLLGASTNYIAGRQCRITGDFGARDLVEVKVIRAFFAMHRTDSYFEVGGYPLDIPSNWFGDDVLALRYLRAGYRHFVSRLFVYHSGSQTMRHRDLSDEKAKGEFWINRKYPSWKKELGYVG